MHSLFYDAILQGFTRLERIVAYGSNPCANGDEEKLPYGAERLCGQLKEKL